MVKTNMYRLLGFDKFPRIMGTPRKKFCPDEESFYKFINNQNGLTGCHISVFHCDTEKKFHNTVLDKFIPEFDEDCINQSLKLHETLMSMTPEGIKHTFIYSGNRSVHPYIFCQDSPDIKIKIDCMRNVQTYFSNTLGFKFDEFFKDKLSHTIRIPNTWHITGERYAIPISISDLKLGMEHIRELAKKQQFSLKIYGKDLFDLKPYDFACTYTESTNKMPDFDYTKLETDDKTVKGLLPCLQLMLLEPKQFCKYDTRRLFVLGCKEQGIPPEMCLELAKKYWKNVRDSSGRKSKYDELIEEHWIDFVYNISEMIFPNCSTVHSKYCVCQGKCPKYRDKGSPLYL